ncbi:biotin transporter BioY [Marinicrinis lubricantis]|uniref:Biotin transporter n=1 Tax=Marinicrinis lubricantis TaxID=2086470 RepID=A0ABW1ITV1_9BACL
MKTKSQRITVRGIVFSALFGALMVVMSFLQIQLGFSPVPITMETMAIMLTGAFLGASYGFFSMFTVVVLVALGLPLLNGQGGLAKILGPTGGFIWMFPLSALLIGYFVNRVKGDGIKAYIQIFIIIGLFGSLLLYVTGVPWLAYKMKVSFAKAMALGCYPYLLGDFAKVVIATIIVVPIRKMYPSWQLTGTGGAKVAILEDSSTRKLS